MEVESATSASAKHSKSAGYPIHRNNRKRRRNLCLAVTAAVILGVILLIIILAFTVFKAKSPVTTVNSVSVKDFELSLLQMHLNISFDVNLSIKNTNKVGFKYTNPTVVVNYRDETVCEASIPAGKISAEQTLPMNLTLTLLADRLLSNGNLYSDVGSGTLPLTTFTRISGEVNIMKLLKIHVVSYTTCDLNVDVMKRSVANRTCHYKTKL